MKIACITCSYNEEKFLPIWMNYYGRQLGYEHLFIIDDESLPPVSTSLNVNILRFGRPKIYSALRPWKLAAQMQNLLFAAGYDVVIFADTDEIICPDPDQYSGIVDFLTRNRESQFTTVGIDLVQNLNEESSFDWSTNLFAQRQYARFSTSYCKTSITRSAWDWSTRVHLEQQSPRPHPGLFQFHIKNIDLTYALKRQARHTSFEWVQEEVDRGIGHQWRLSLQNFVERNFIVPLSIPISHSWNFDTELQHCANYPGANADFDSQQPFRVIPSKFKELGI
jgi:hypothetical protein